MPIRDYLLFPGEYPGVSKNCKYLHACEIDDIPMYYSLVHLIYIYLVNKASLYDPNYMYTIITYAKCSDLCFL